MAHFAEIENFKVVNVIVVSNDDCGGGDFPASEPIGQAYLASCGIEGEYLQTSYHNNFRGWFAGIGDIYDPVNDVFIRPRTTPVEP